MTLTEFCILYKIKLNCSTHFCFCIQLLNGVKLKLYIVLNTRIFIYYLTNFESFLMCRTKRGKHTHTQWNSFLYKKYVFGWIHNTYSDCRFIFSISFSCDCFSLHCTHTQIHSIDSLNKFNNSSHC